MRRNSFRNFFLSFLFLCIILLTFTFKVSDGFEDTSGTLDMVVAVYEEDLSWLKDIPSDFYTQMILYNKGSPKDFSLPKTRIVDIPNYGRDGYAYLYHVVHNYENLADITFFFQGSTMSHEAKKLFFNAITEHLKNKKQSCIPCMKGSYDTEHAMQLSVTYHLNTNPANRTKNPETSLTPARDRPLGSWFNKRFPGETIECVSYLGILAVSKEDILKRPRSFYEGLLDELSLENPEVAHYTERTWIHIFSVSENSWTS